MSSRLPPRSSPESAPRSRWFPILAALFTAFLFLLLFGIIFAPVLGVIAVFFLVILLQYFIWGWWMQWLLKTPDQEEGTNDAQAMSQTSSEDFPQPPQ